MQGIQQRRLIEKRRRGIFGWLFLIVFWAWNALMAVALYNAMVGAGELGQAPMTEPEKLGHSIGVGLGFTMVLMIWALGAMITGALAYFARGKTELIEVITTRS